MAFRNWNGKFVWVLGISTLRLCTTKSVSRAVQWPDDVIGPHPLRPSALWRAVNGRPMDVRRREFGELSFRECICQRNDFELIPTVKVKARHPVEKAFGNEFPFICNHCGVMAALSCKTLKKSHFAFFLEKRPLTGNFSKLCSESFHRDTDWRVVFKFREIWLTGSRWNRAMLSWQTKQNFAWLSSSRYCADPKICQGCSPDNVLRVLQISSKSVQFWRSYIRKREYHQNEP